MTVNRVGGGDAPYVRFVQIDALRGFAVLGIYWINICIFALPAIDGVLPPQFNDDSLVNTLVSLFGEVYVEGTMRGLFSLLFGASALIFLDEAKLATSGVDLVDRYYRRTLLLILFGMIHAYFLLWPHDVLYAYGLFGLFLFPLRKLSAWTLLVCALVLLTIGDMSVVPPDSNKSMHASITMVDVADEEENLPLVPPGTGIENKVPEGVDQTQEATQSDSNVSNAMAPEDAIALSVRSELVKDLYHSGYTAIFNAQLNSVIEKESLAIYQDGIFDIGGMMLLGMALFKLGVLTGRARRRVYLLLLVTGYVLGSSIRYVIATDSPDPDHDYNLGRVFIVLGHIGVIGITCQLSAFQYIVKKLASVGRMALTNYIMQTLISIFLFYGIGFSLYGELERYQLLLVCIGVWIFQIILSNLWLVWFKHGPLEWLWRSMIYGKRQAFRKPDSSVKSS